MIKKDWLLEASVDYEQTYTVESETGDPSYEDMVEAQTIAEDHGCKEYMLTELD